MNLDEIKELMDALAERDILEFELERDGERIRIRRSGPNDSGERPPYVIVTPTLANNDPAQLPISNPAPAAASAGQPADTEPAASQPETEDDLTRVLSPIVGTFYGAPSPDAESFVNVGDHVKVGQVLCIIEAMKLMNEIESEVAGTIRKIHAQNAEPVEYDQPLFLIEPA